MLGLVLASPIQSDQRRGLKEREVGLEKIRTLYLAELGPPLVLFNPTSCSDWGKGWDLVGRQSGQRVGAPKSGGKKLFFALDFFLPSRLLVNIAKTAHPLAVFQRQLTARSGLQDQTATMPLFILTETSAG